MVQYGSVKTFAELFKKYRLRAEFATFAEFGDALSEKGYYYEDSIFSHWQKGTRIPTERKLVLAIIGIFIDKHAITTLKEINEFLAVTSLGYLTEEEEEQFKKKINHTSHNPISRFKIFGVLIISFIVLLGLFFFYSYVQSHSQKDYEESPPTVPSAVTEPKKLVIGVDATLDPMEYLENDHLVGFDVDLGRYLAKELGADIEFRNIVFDNLFNSLEQRKINMIISAVTITGERKKTYDFSEPYLNAGQVIITKKTNKIIKGVADLKGKRIATQTGTTNEQEALKHTLDRLVIRYPDFVHATNALINGEADALFTDLPNATGIIAKNSDLKMISPPFTQEYYGIVFIKGDPSVTQINDAIASLRQKGILNKLEKKWLR